MSFHAFVVVIDDEVTDVARARRVAELADGTLFVGDPWPVDGISYCPRCDAYGAEQSCQEDGKLIDDHDERGTGDPVFDTSQVIEQHPDVA